MKLVPVKPGMLNSLHGKKDGYGFRRAWTRVTEDTGIGNPAKATAEKGKRYLEAITDKIADFLVELASAPGRRMK